MTGSGGIRWTGSEPDSSRPVLDALDELGREERFDAGQLVFIEGETSGRVVIVRSGTLRVTATERGGDRVLAIVGPGTILGEFSALDGEPHGATVTAIEPVEASVVGAAEFTDFLRSSPDAALWLARNVLRRMRGAERRRMEFVPTDVAARVAGALVDRAHAQGGARELRVTRAEIARGTGLATEVVSTALGAMQAHGWVEVARGRVRILDLEALRRRSS